MINCENGKLYKRLGLTDFEFIQIKNELQREPNETEIYLFSAMWSEHCGYSHSKKYLSRFPKKGSLLSEENAGGVQIGDNIIFFKAESHNHPSAIEPFEGAATGIGGIIRDVLALGARPIALLDSLKFGRIDKKDASNHSKHLLEGVVRGISTYGNSIGVPTVAGEVGFDEVFENSPLVNVMAVGIAHKDEIKISSAPIDNYVVVLGSHTGRDGIHGASFASKELSENSNEDRPSVQVGDPFIKKILIEATLEISKLENVLACQDCGAAGLLSSTSEMAYKGNCGMELFLDKVHLREKNMKPWEIMLSESQERMIFIANKKGVEEIMQIAEKYELPVSLIGKTIEKNEYRLFFDDKLIANVPPSLLNNGVLYDLTEVEPPYIKEYKEKVYPKGDNLYEAIEKIVKDPNFASKRWIFEQYDHTVGNRTVLTPSTAGSAGIWIFENDGVIGLTIDSNPRAVFLNPFEGSAQCVLESARNLVSSGFKPLGLTDCLNFGNPEKDEVAYQFVKSVDGIAFACEKLDIPVVSGNVSFYNECENVRVYPTPTIGMVGYCDNPYKVLRAKFKENEKIYLLGNDITPLSKLGASLYQMSLSGFLGGEIDTVDFELEKKLMKTIFDLRDNKKIKGCIDVGEMGLLGALLEGLFNGNTGFKGNLLLSEGTNEIDFLFGEIFSRYLVSTTENIEEYLEKNNIPYRFLGIAGGDILKFNDYEFDISKLRESYMNSIKNEVENV